MRVSRRGFAVAIAAAGTVVAGLCAAAPIAGANGTTAGGSTAGRATSAVAAQAFAYWNIVAKHSSKCMRRDILTNAVFQYTCSDGNNSERWRLEGTGDGAYKIIYFESSLCLEVPRGSGSYGENLKTATCNGQDHQKFEFIHEDSLHSQIRPRHSFRCLEVDNAGQGNYVVVQQAVCAFDTPPHPSRLWRLHYPGPP